MKLYNKWILSALMLAFSVVFLFSAGMAGAAIDGGYVGSDTCGACHTAIKADFDKSGHPYKVRFTKGLFPVTSGGDNVTTITDPLSALLVGYTPTLGTLSTSTNNALMVDDGTGRLDWSAVSYVIGGFGWKARWGMLDVADADGDGIDDTGYVWTGSGAQYNMHTDNYAGYNSGTDKKYSCAICHNTNGTSSVDAGCSTALGSGRTEPWASSGRTPAAPGGFRSEWTFSGVQCEACHGAGETHAGAPSAANIVKDTSKDVCGKCHIRSSNTAGFGGECGGDASPAILANGAPTTAGSFGSHHQQYNEMVGYNGDGAHASLDCVTCHDPHKRSHKVTDAIAAAKGITDNNLSAEARGAIRKSCSDCHIAQADADAVNAAAMVAAHRTNNVTCADCHMAEQTKSATNSPTTGWGRKADVKSHIVRIDPNQTANTRINADGVTIATNYLTAAYACGKCHDGAIYGSSISGPLTMAAAQAAAVGYHNVTGIDGGHVGSEACAGCHTQNYNDFVQSGHPYKVRFTNGATPTPGTDPLSALLSSTMPNTADLLNPNNETDVKVTDVNGKLDWSAVSYVIGGFGWKARWGVKDTVDDSATGYIWSSSVSSPTGAQFNMLAADTSLDPDNHRADWSSYGSATKKYSCAICHNTNGTSSTDALCSTPLGSGRTEPWASTGLTSAAPGGFRSEWTYSGVQCEACHGPAANHVKSPSSNALGVLNVTHGANSYEICAKCHIRTNNNDLGYGAECGGDSNEAILTSGSTSAANGIEGHHQQFNQLFGLNGDGAHASLECTACHNPHKRAHKVTGAIASALGITDNDLSAEARGAVKSCSSCHAPENPGAVTKISSTAHSASAGCVDCHMAETTKSATGSVPGNIGDVKGHIFKIDSASSTLSRTNSYGKTIAPNAITVDFACGKCHGGSAGAGATTNGAPYLSRETAALYAPLMHSGSNSGTVVQTGAEPVLPPSEGCDSGLAADGTMSSSTGTTATVFTLTDTTTQAHSLHIYWGDGTGITSDTAHTYNNIGTYQIIQTVTNPCGYRSQKVHIVTVTGGTTGKGTMTLSATGSVGSKLSYSVLNSSGVSITNGTLTVGADAATAATKVITLDGGAYGLKIGYSPVAIADPIVYKTCDPLTGAADVAKCSRPGYADQASCEAALHVWQITGQQAPGIAVTGGADTAVTLTNCN